MVHMGKSNASLGIDKKSKDAVASIALSYKGVGYFGSNDIDWLREFIQIVYVCDFDGIEGAIAILAAHHVIQTIGDIETDYVPRCPKVYFDRYNERDGLAISLRRAEFPFLNYSLNRLREVAVGGVGDNPVS
jgi:hypothetical protein